MKDLLWLVRKTLVTSFRKKSNIIVFFILPIAGVLLSMFIYGNSSGSNLHVGVVNQDGNQVITQHTIEYLQKLNHVRVTETDEATLQKDIAAGKLDSGLVINQGFAANVQRGEPANLQLISVKGASVTAYVKAMLNNYITNIAAIGKAAAGHSEQFNKVYNAYQASEFAFYSESLTDTSKTTGMAYQSLGFLVAFMLYSSFNLCENLLRDKENRTFLRLLSSPVSAKTYVFSNVVVNYMMLFLQIILTLLFMKYIVQIDPGVPMLELILMLMMFGLPAISLCMMIISFANSGRAAGALSNLIITPTSILAGCYFPANIMPDTIRKISNFMPQRWILDIVIKLQEGQSLSSLVLNIAVLVAFAAAFVIIAIFCFSRNNDVKQFV